uniref:Subtilisin-like protease isoform X1 n=1 Tax=Saccharum spontaneum TaxID=62335 RepID=A0A678THV8_SACSP|nr:subtilisin-like protease isoform X1 [Saccharum spontaneum]
MSLSSSSVPSSRSVNWKLIGARYYDVTQLDHEFSASILASKNASHAGAATTGGSPRDTEGHGTHTVSTAAGAAMPHASYHGLAWGTAKGGAWPCTCKACSHGGCTSSAVLKAIDNTVSDGVDVISISIGAGGSPQQAKFLDDPIALGAFHAHQQGVLVVFSAGKTDLIPTRSSTQIRGS